MQPHPASETNNPLVDMQTMMPVAKLDDAGIGLRDNGRRVLTYADLRSAFADPDGREPGRTIELHLTGHMERFSWSFDGIPFADAEPIRLRYGERVRFVLVNDTMMHHHSPARAVERPGGRTRRLPGAQAHHRHAAGLETQLPGHSRRPRPLGLPLPHADAHGPRNVP